MKERDRLADILRRRGLRVTPQRLAILSFLDGNTDHPTAEDIYAAVKAQHPAISLNTVYKTLEAFEEADLVWRFRAGQKHKSHYDPNSRTHPHVVCTRCGSVDDLPDDGENLQADAEKSLPDGHHDVLRVEVCVVVGLCEECDDHDE